MSWTQDVEKAQWFAARTSLFYGEPTGMVFTATVDPTWVLGAINGGRGEAEIVVDPVGLPTLRRQPLVPAAMASVAQNSASTPK
jgi:hypothetical protein